MVNRNIMLIMLAHAQTARSAAQATGSQPPVREAQKVVQTGAVGKGAGVWSRIDLVSWTHSKDCIHTSPSNVYTCYPEQRTQLRQLLNFDVHVLGSAGRALVWVIKVTVLVDSCFVLQVRGGKVAQGARGL